MIKKLAAAFIATVVMLTSAAVPVSASPEYFYDDNDITYYNADAQAACLPETDTGTGNAPLETPTGGSTGEQALSFFMSKGLSRNQALGILGNLMQESGGGTLNLNPRIENSIGAYGIAQWLKGRRTNLQAFAVKNGTTEADFSAQINFLWHELNTSYKSNVLTPIMAASSISEASRIFLERFEIPCSAGKGCDKEAAHRLSLANKADQALSGVSGGESTGDISTSIDVDNSCRQDQSAGGGAGAGSDTSPGSVNADGYAVPLKNFTADKRLLTCTPTSCHHDKTAAFDLIVPPGTPVVAITDGYIRQIGPYNVGTASGDSKCRSVQFQGEDGWTYWYGHTYVNHAAGKRFKAGEVMGVVGSKACGLGNAAHLHIDRGSPKGRTGGEDAHRDSGFIALMQSIFRNQLKGASAL